MDSMSPRSPRSLRSPGRSLSVPTVLPGLDEILYREAEERKQRQKEREQEAMLAMREASIPRLSKTSRVYLLQRLQRQLLEAFERCQGRLVGERRALAVPRHKLAAVLRCMAFAAEPLFCQRLSVLLDREESGMICFDRLLCFISTALDTDRAPPQFLACSLEEECFNQLEWQLSKEFSRLLCMKHSLATTESFERRTREPSPQTLTAAPTPRRTATPRSARSASCDLSRDRDGRVSRCHLLYHQAVFAARKGAQLEKEIKELNELQEMQECTFQPQLVARRRPSFGRPHVRNFEETVTRMKQAQRQHLRRQRELERISLGEKYETLRNLGVQPFSCAFSPRSKPRPLVYVDVKVGRGRSGRVGVKEGDDVRQLARSFAKAFQLDKDALRRLEALLRQAYAWRAWQSAWQSLRR